MQRELALRVAETVGVAGVAHQANIGWRDCRAAARRHIRHVHLPTITGCAAIAVTAGTAEAHLPAYPERIVEAAAANKSNSVYRECDGPPCSLQLLRQKNCSGHLP